MSRPTTSFRSGAACAMRTSHLELRRGASSGRGEAWRLIIPQHRPLTTPAFGLGRVFVGGGFGSREFYALDALSGEPIWALGLSDDGPSAAVLSEGCVVFNTESCTLFAVNAATGQHLWSRWLGDPLMSQPAIHQGIVVTAYPHADGWHRLAAFDLDDGLLRWEASLWSDIITAPVIEQDAVFATTHDGVVHRHDLRSGELHWSRPMHASSAPWVMGNDVFVSQREDRGYTTPDEGISSLSRDDGQLTSWMSSRRRAPYIDERSQSSTTYERTSMRHDAGVGFGSGAPPSAKAHFAARTVGQKTVKGLWEYQGSRPTVDRSKAYSTQGTAVVAVNTETGEVLWEQPLRGDADVIGGHLGTPPAQAGGRIVVGTVSGDVLVNDDATGELLARYKVGDEIRYQPILSGGRIYVGTATGSLVCLETEDLSLDGWPMWGGGPRHNGSEVSAENARAELR